MRIMFMGTPDFAVPSLQALLTKHEVVCVVSQPDKPKGRGHTLQPTATKIVAQQHGIPVEQPISLKDGAFMPVLEKHQPDLIVAVAYGKILPEYILNYPKYRCINVHGSLLPKYRGAAPIQWAVLNGDEYSGVTIMYMGKEMDTGDIILTKQVKLKEYETSGELFDRLSVLGAEALLEAVESIENHTVTAVAQNHEEATYAPMLSKEMSLLNFTMPSKKFVNYVQGLNPWPIARIQLGEQEIKVFSAAFGNKTTASAGSVCSITKEGMEIACGDGESVVLKQLQRPGKKATDGYSFAQGLRLKEGDIL